MYPVVILAGKAGSGKDTVAAMLAEAGGVCIAQADPLKRFGRDVFAFSDDQLWGPSESRNAVDPRGESPEFWEMLWARFDPTGTRTGTYYRPSTLLTQDVDLWLTDVGLPDDEDRKALAAWFYHEVAYGQKHGVTPRHVLQTLGTEFGRERRETVWVDYAQRMARRLLDGNLGYLRQRGAVPKHVGRTEFVVITDGRFPNEILATKAAGGLAVKITGPGATGLQGSAGQHASETQQDGIPDHWYDAVVWNDKSKGFEPLRRQVAHLARAVVCRPPLMSVPGEAVAL